MVMLSHLNVEAAKYSYQGEAIVSVFVISGALLFRGKVVTSLSYSHCDTEERYQTL